jgi:HAD superfamily hydrolase (TIGR01458 family)
MHPIAGLDGIRGVLLDIDGTLLTADREIPGAAAAVRGLRAADVPFRLMTNTTRRPRSAIARVLKEAGFDVDAGHVLTPSVLARRRILDSGAARAALLVAGATLEDLDGVVAVAEGERADWVVVGDLGPGFTFDVLDGAMARLLDGARLLALQKNRYWHDGTRLRIDAGPFVAALEYAAGVEAEVVGKPSIGFFRLAAADLGVDDPGAILMVGDDVSTDIAGGHAFGCRTAQVRTGKFRPGDLDRTPSADVVVDSVADLVR